MKKLYCDMHRAFLIPSGEINMDEPRTKETKVIKQAV